MELNELYEKYLAFPVIETDSRKVTAGSAFFALKGPNFNGNHYVQQALDRGASLCIADEDTGIKNNGIIKVNDVLETLQALAKKHRQHFNIPFIAITGSNGKTTTKELLHAVLSSAYKTYTTQGNLNNHIGIPLTILKVKRDAEIAVIEMGANHLKEIEGYCNYTLPTHGLITNCGKAHLEGFGGEEGVKKGKGELFEYLKSSGGTAFINNDYDYLVAMSKGIQNITTYGTGSADIIGKQIISDNEYVHVAISKGSIIPEIKTHLVGGYNLPNILAAVAVGKAFAVSDEQIKSALENYLPSNSRSQLIEQNGNRIILDAYNANPSSMQAAVNNFSGISAMRKVVFLGGMKELGADSFKEHEALVNLLRRNEWEHVVLVGSEFENLSHKYIYFKTSAEAAKWFESKHFTDTHILIKGSRSLMMEKVLESS